MENELVRLAKPHNTHQFSKEFLLDPVFAYTDDDNEHDDIKIVYLNINGLLHAQHLKDLKSDLNLTMADIICIAETKLDPNIDPDSVTLDGFTTMVRLDFQENSMGMILFCRDEIDVMADNSNTFTDRDRKTQMIGCEIAGVPIMFVKFTHHTLLKA